MRTLPRTPLDGRVQEGRVSSVVDHPTSPPPLIRRFPREASLTEPPVALQARASEPPIESAGAERWYAVFLSVFLIGLLVLGGFWIWLNIRFY
ncbi:MAG TPA: hypothetical protein VFH48_01420 [Chloroflexota bacterium]|nr:hypothetical protein [Chloroflexota bacterium]